MIRPRHSRACYPTEAHFSSQSKPVRFHGSALLSVACQQHTRHTCMYHGVFREYCANTYCSVHSINLIQRHYPRSTLCHDIRTAMDVHRHYMVLIACLGPWWFNYCSYGSPFTATTKSDASITVLLSFTSKTEHLIHRNQPELPYS